MLFSKLVSTGSYLPKKILTNDDLSKIVDTSDEWIVSMTGIKKRHIVAENEMTSDLATAAAVAAMKKANLQASDIDAIIVATTTPDLTFPSTASIVQKKLGNTNAFAFDLQAVCSGFIYALSVADSLVRAGRAATVLVIGAEAFSKIVDWSDRNTCVLFGDGAGAVILQSTILDPSKDANSGIIAVELFSDGSHVDHLKTTGGVCHGEIGKVIMNGSEVFKYAVNNMVSVAEYILKKNSLQKSDLNWLVPHQANIRIIQAMGKKLDLPNNRVIVTVDQHGNTSAASVPLALDYAFKENKFKKGDLVLLEAMGGGFTWGAGLLRI